jgi:Uncharacterised ACR, YggU family COG1872
MLTTLKVRVIPNARRSEVSTIGLDEVRIKVHAPALEGKANAEVDEAARLTVRGRPIDLRQAIGRTVPPYRPWIGRVLRQQKSRWRY